MTKTPEEVELMAESGRLLASVFTHLDGLTLAGMTTLEVNDRVEAFITDDLKARPASKGQYGYGFVLNCSINEVVCHGVPSADAVLRDGDIVNLDITLEKHGFIADSSKTYLIGNVGPAARKLVRTTYEALWKGIRAVRPGARLGDIDQRMSALRTEQSAVGSRHALIMRAEETVMDKTGSLEAQRASVEDIELSRIILDLKAQEISYQAALGVTARVLQPTLMDFLR